MTLVGAIKSSKDRTVKNVRRKIVRCQFGPIGDLLEGQARFDWQDKNGKPKILTVDQIKVSDALTEDWEATTWSPAVVEEKA